MDKTIALAEYPSMIRKNLVFDTCEFCGKIATYLFRFNGVETCYKCHCKLLDSHGC